MSILGVIVAWFAAEESESFSTYWLLILNVHIYV